MAEGTKLISDEVLMGSLERFCNIAVTPEMLKSPTPQFLETVFNCLMRDLQLNIDAIKQVPFKSTTLLEHPEQYEDILPFVTYFSVMKQILDIAGISDFGIKDLLEPKPKRTKKILIFVISLWKHVLTKCQKYKEVKDQMQAENDEKLSLQERMLDLEERYKQMIDMGIDAAKREELFNIKSACERQMAEMKKEKEEISNKYQAMKTEIADRLNKISELDVNIITQKEKLEDLNNAIVQSPARISSEAEELSRKLAEENAKVVDMMKKVKEKKQEIEDLVLKLEVFQNVVSEVKDAMAKSELLRKEAASVNWLEEALNAKAKEIKKLETHLESTNEKVHVLEQRMTQLQLQNKSEIEGLQQLSNMHERSIDKEFKVLKEEEEMEKILQEEVKVISKEITEVENVFANFIDGKERECSEVQKAFDDLIHRHEMDTTEAASILKELLSGWSEK